jgi:MSHA biogenesis protein MshN
VSLINKVLRDLDRRNATATPSVGVPPTVKVVEATAASHEWFWRVIAALMLLALGWVGWLIYQIQPRPIATPLAQKAADEARTRRPAPPVQVAEVPRPPVQAPAPPAAEPKAAAPAAAVQPADTLRFAYSIETPIDAPAPKPATPPSSTAEKRQPTRIVSAAPATGNSRVERRDRVLSGPERADGEFRRGVDLLKVGRAHEAEGAFTAALKFDPKYHGARQALVALRLERGQLEDANRLLQEGLAVDPAQPDFAVALARIRVERGQLLSALDALDAAASGAAGHAEFHLLRGTVLQRLGRHAEAADAYRGALGVQRATPQAWMGLGISLEALQQKPEAAQAFRNALASGPVSAELRTFAEQRIRALR